MRSRLVEERRLVWHAAELPGAVGCARQRNLFVVETSGEAVTVVQFDTQWRREAGFNHRDQQWVLLDGSIDCGDETITAPSYLLLPGGAVLPPMVISAGSRAVVCRESSWYFEETDWMQPWASETFSACSLGDHVDDHTSTRVLRDHEGEQALLMQVEPGTDVRWPAGAHSAVLIDDRLLTGSSPLLAPVGLFGDLSSASIPSPGEGQPSHRWFVLTRTASHEAEAACPISDSADLPTTVNRQSEDSGLGKAE